MTVEEATAHSNAQEKQTVEHIATPVVPRRCKGSERELSLEGSQNKWRKHSAFLGDN